MKLKNPYSQSSDLIKIQAKVDRSDYNLINVVAIRYNVGLQQFAFGSLTKHLAAVCKQNNWSLNNGDELVNYITTLLPEAVGTNVGRGVNSLGSPSADDPNRHATVPETPSAKKGPGKHKTVTTG